MATRVIDNRTLEERQEDWLRHLPDKFMPCRGDRHEFAVLKPGKLPRGIRAIPLHDGSFQIIAACRNCGRERTKTTLPGGRYDRDARYVYKDPEGYKAPPGLGLSKADYTEELYRRVGQALVANDQLALADLAPDDLEPAAGRVPFSNGGSS